MVFVRSVRIPLVDEALTFNLHVRATLADCSIPSLDTTLQQFLDSHGYSRIDGHDFFDDSSESSAASDPEGPVIWKALVSDGTFEYWLVVTARQAQLRIEACYISDLADVDEDYSDGFVGIRREYSFARMLVTQVCTFLIAEAATHDNV